MKKLFAIMLVFCMIFTMIPLTVAGEEQPTAKFISISTSLGGNIAMNFYVELSEELVRDRSAYIQFTFAGRTVSVPLCQGFLARENVYRYSCPITSKNMTDKITAQVYNADGPVGESKTMDVATYCNWVIANTGNEKSVNLMKAMLNYGAAAQTAFNYRTDDLANAALAEADKVLDAVDASAYAHSRTGEAGDVWPVSYTLLLDSFAAACNYVIEMNGYSVSATGSYKVLTYSDAELSWGAAIAQGQTAARRGFITDSGAKITYEGVNEDGLHVFHAHG